jgi:hypothetical protein
MKKWPIAFAVLISMFSSIVLADAAQPASAGIDGIWNGVIGGAGNHLVMRVAGNPGRFTCTTDSPSQGVVALPTGVVIDGSNDVVIKIDEPSPLRFTGILNGDTMTGTWAEDTHTGPMTWTRAPVPSIADPGFVPHLAGTWEGVRPGFGLHLIFHISGIPGYYHASADSPDQNALGLAAGAKIDSLNNVFLSIGFFPPMYFTGYYNGDTIAGTVSQDGAMNEMTFTRQTQP